MLRLSKKQQSELAELESNCYLEASNLETAIATFNQTLGAAKEKLEEDQQKYNDELEKLRDFRDGIVSEMDDYIADRSEKWQEGERGQNYVSWKDEWEQLDLEPIELSLPDELDSDEFNYSEQPISENVQLEFEG